VVVTSAGELGAKYVFHAVTIGRKGYEPPPDAILRHATRKTIRLAPLLGCRSIAFPALGTGNARMPFRLAASQMAVALVEGLLDAREPVQVELRLMDPGGSDGAEVFFRTFEEHAARSLGLEATRRAAELALAPPSLRAGASASAEPEARRREQVYQMLRTLDARRNDIETALIEALDDNDSRPRANSAN